MAETFRADHPLCYETDPGTDELAPDGYASYQFDMDVSEAR